jgi:hypothetical protein
MRDFEQLLDSVRHSHNISGRNDKARLPIDHYIRRSWNIRDNNGFKSHRLDNGQAKTFREGGGRLNQYVEI